MSESAAVEYTLLIRNMPADERPRERLQHYGPGALASAELLAILLRVGIEGESVLHVAQRLLGKYGGLPGLARASFDELCQEKALGPAKVTQLKAALELGKRLLDKLVRVTLLSGQESWVYIHLEIQGTPQAEFPERMFVYNYRSFDRFRRPIASMALLADDAPNWKPQEYRFEVLGCKHTLEFPVAKLLDYAGQEAALQDDPNPFALVTLAHLQTRATRKNPQARFEAKWKLVQLLYRRGWDKQRIIDLFLVIDWMMHLPDFLSQQL